MAFTRENSAGWVAGDKITSAQINGIDRDKALAIDGTGGGTYTLAAKLSFQGTGGVEFAGTGDGRWPLLSSRTVKRVHQLEIMLDGDGVASIAKSDLLSGSYYAPELKTTQLAAVGYAWVPLRGLPDGGTLVSLDLQKKWTNVSLAASSSMSTYDIVRWFVQANGSLSVASLLTAPTNDSQSTVDYATWSTYASQVLACAQNNVIDTGSYAYALIIKTSAVAAVANICHIVEMVSSSTVTKIQA